MNKQLHNPKYRKELENRLKENNKSVFSKTQQEKINSFWLVYDRDMYVGSQDFHIDKCLDLIDDINSLLK